MSTTRNKEFHTYMENHHLQLEQLAYRQGWVWYYNGRVGNDHWSTCHPIGASAVDIVKLKKVFVDHIANHSGMGICMPDGLLEDWRLVQLCDYRTTLRNRSMLRSVDFKIIFVLHADGL